MPEMMLTDLISTIEAEIETQYIGGAIAWADKHQDNAWSKAIDRYEKALSLVAQTLDKALFIQESEFYKTTVLNLLKLYKAYKSETEAVGFLKVLEVTMKGE